MKKGRYPAAWHSFARLRNYELLAARDMYMVHCQIEIERSISECLPSPSTRATPLTVTTFL